MSTKLPVYAFVGSILPEHLSDHSPGCFAAGNKFQFHLIRALKRASQLPLDVFSVRPIGCFPKTGEIWIGAARVDMGEGIRCRMIPFVNMMFLKQLTIGLANLFFIGTWLWRWRGHQRYVFVYNVYPPMSLPVLLATWLFGGRAIALVLDFPHNLSFEFVGLRGLLQKMDVFLERRCLSRFSGLIALTQYVAKDFAPDCPSLVLEGGVDPDDAYLEQDCAVSALSSREHICFFSGSLNEVNGVTLLLEAFRQITDPDYRLWIFGNGPLKPVVEEAAARDRRIVYWGFISNGQVVRLQKNAMVLLNARPSNQRITRYTFPSKLLEYMVSGRPVITTDLPGIPNEYHEFVYILRDETPEGLSNMICDVGSRPPIELDELGRRALRFVLCNKGWADTRKTIPRINLYTRVFSKIRRMRIGLNLLHAMPEIGGGWNYIDRLIKALGEYDRDNRYVAFVTDKSTSLVPQQPNFESVYVRINPSSRRSAYFMKIRYSK